MLTALRTVETMRGVRADEAVRTLPGPYVEALRLAAAGRSDEEVARTIGIPDASVPALLQLAAAKLARALRREGSPTSA